MSAVYTIGWNNEDIKPTTGQRAILAAIDRSSLISALAGSGKTTTLCMAACGFLAHRRLTSGKAKRNVLMIAHSEAGLVAIKERFKIIHGRMPDDISLMTVERLCKRALERQGQSINTPESWLHKKHLVAQAKAALEMDLEQNPDEDMASMLTRSLDVDAFTEFEKKVKRRLLQKRLEESGQGLQEFCNDMDLNYPMFRLYLKYERMRMGTDSGWPGIFSEGDCTYEMCRQIDELDWESPHPNLTSLYDAVLVDELHDIDEASLNVLRSMMKGDNGIFIGAGDFNQHILDDAFSVFSDEMARIRESLPLDTQILRLNQTRRFGSSICDGLNNLFGLNFTTIKSEPGLFTPCPMATTGNAARCCAPFTTWFRI